jgi:hypothetical protein
MSCHGGLVAHNIEYDMVSHWEMTFFCRFVHNIMRDIRHGISETQRDVPRCGALSLQQ